MLHRYGATQTGGAAFDPRRRVRKMVKPKIVTPKKPLCFLDTAQNTLGRRRFSSERGAYISLWGSSKFSLAKQRLLCPESVGTHDALWQPAVVGCFVVEEQQGYGDHSGTKVLSLNLGGVLLRTSWSGLLIRNFVCTYLFWNEDSRLPVAGRRVFLGGEGPNILGVPLKCVGVQRGLNPLR